jgi:hypothetical protein
LAGDRWKRDPQDGEIGYIASVGTTKAVVPPGGRKWPRNHGGEASLPTTIDLTRVVRLELLELPIAFRKEHALPQKGVVVADLRNGEILCLPGKEVPLAELPDRAHVRLHVRAAS